LISTPSEELLDPKYTSYAIGLGYLGAVLEEKGHYVECLYLYCESWKRAKIEIINKLKEFEPDVVGFNVLSMNRVSTYDSIHIVKEILPTTKIICGGFHPTVMYRQMLENFPIDVICIGEGEKTIVELIECFRKQGNLKSVKGIAYREKNEIVLTEPRETIKNLDSIPFPKHEYFIRKWSRKAYMITSRGCINRCKYCASVTFWGQRIRFRSPKNVVDEIETIINNFPQIKEIQFMDDSFTTNNRWVIEICKEIIRRNIKIKWSCSGRIWPFSKEMVRWMEKSGCYDVGFGVESGDDKLMEVMNKNVTSEQIKQTLRTITENSNINPRFYLFVGTPGENEETIKNTINLLNECRRIRHGNPIHIVNVGILWLFPGTEFYELAKKQRFVDDSIWLTRENVPYYTYEHSLEELQNFANKIVRENMLANKTQFFTYATKYVIRHPFRFLKLIRSGFLRRLVSK